MQFYVGDWVRDPELSICTPSSRGIWMDLICAMHDLGRSGIVTGTVEQLCRKCRCTAAEMSAALVELKATKTADISERNGVFTIICRRLQREHNERVKTRDRVRKYRGYAQDTDPELMKRDCNAPSSSSEELENTDVFSSEISDFPADEPEVPKPTGASKPKAKPKTKPEGDTRTKNPQFRVFAERFLLVYGSPYLHKQADFVQQAQLRKKCESTNWELTDERWKQAVDHYFATNQGTHTLADLCTRFSTFYRAALNDYGKVDGIKPGNGVAADGKRTVVV